MIHKLDRSKVEEELLKRGWKRGVYKEWLVPDTASWWTIEEDWTEAVLSGIICELEEKKKKNEEFLKKHPTPKR